MGAKFAPDKSYNYGSTSASRKWLVETWWPHIGTTIEVIRDIRYFGSHLSAAHNSKSSTLEARWQKAIAQLRRSMYMPATIDARAKVTQATKIRGSHVRHRGC